MSLTGSNQTTCVAAQRAQPQSALRMRLPTNGWTLTSSVLLTFWFIRVYCCFIPAFIYLHSVCALSPSFQQVDADFLLLPSVAAYLLDTPQGACSFLMATMQY